MSDIKMLNILLLTNRDSDNAGDQVIETCDISLSSTVMRNLDIKDGNYIINSRAAGMITKKYLETRDEELLKPAEETIKNSDIIIFGGAPLFNYKYQLFSERTAITLEIAQKYNKPVIFSAIGVEGYDEGNEKCQRLKKTLNFDCVKQITTRDDLESLKKFIDNEQIAIGRVSDPAVFVSKVFENFISKKEEKKKIGIFILRANGFKDNGVDFSREDAAELWGKTICELEDRGYDYELLTSGHFGDEAFLDLLVKKYDFALDKCVFNINSPERLVQKISGYDAVVTCRLHPSIISFALGVPSLGIVWNSKVRYFYDSIGYGDRGMVVDGISPEKIAEKIDQIAEQKMEKDEGYITSIYNYLFNTMKKILVSEDSGIEPYSYGELMEQMPVFGGTSAHEMEEKLKKKFRRAYGAYNDLFEKKLENTRLINELTCKCIGYTLIYNGGVKSDKLAWKYDGSKGELKRLETDSVEYKMDKPVLNSGQSRAMKNQFEYPEYAFLGWRMRVKNDEKWYWYMEDRTYKPMKEYVKGKGKERFLLKDCAKIPHIPAKHISVVVLEAVWEPKVTTKVMRRINKFRGQK